MRDEIELADGTRLAMRSLRRRVPHVVFTGALHLEVCERLARARTPQAPPEPGPETGPDPRLDPVYVNYLFGKSDRARELTAALELAHAGVLRIRAVRSRLAGPDFADLFGPGVRIEPRGGAPRSLINPRQVALFAAKVFAHRLFRALGRGAGGSRVVVRAWVEETEHLYPELVARARLFVYPFRASVRRQLLYLRHCQREKRDFRLMGVPYRIADLLRILARWPRRDALIVSAEAQAFRRHAEELVAAGVTHVYTTDEFEMAGLELHTTLQRHGVICSNACHGIACYGPYVSYSHFSFFNTTQRDYYLSRGAIRSHDFARRHAIANPAPEPSASDYDPVVVYLLGNWRRAHKLYEADFEERAVQAASESCRRLGLPLVLKAHPSLSGRKLARLARRHGAQVTRTLDPLRGRHPVFLNLHSTSYYTFLELGPTLFLSDDLLAPERLFGKRIPCVRLAGLDRELGRFRERASWITSRRVQLEREARSAGSACVSSS